MYKFSQRLKKKEEERRHSLLGLELGTCRTLCWPTSIWPPGTLRISAVSPFKKCGLLFLKSGSKICCSWIYYFALSNLKKSCFVLVPSEFWNVFIMRLGTGFTQQVLKLQRGLLDKWFINMCSQAAQWLNTTTQMEPPYPIEEVVCVFVKTVIHMVFSQGARLWESFWNNSLMLRWFVQWKCDVNIALLPIPEGSGRVLIQGNWGISGKLWQEHRKTGLADE